MIFVSFYTPAYEPHAVKLMRSLERWQLDYDIEERPQTAGWCATCATKPAYILAKRNEYDGPLVWVDADATVDRDPIILREGYDADIAVHYRDGHELLSGTIWIGDTPGARDLLHRWSAACQRDPGVWDQRTLQKIVESGAYRVAQLPAAYVAIYDAKMSDNPVITHWQASRQSRKVVGH